MAFPSPTPSPMSPFDLMKGFEFKSFNPADFEMKTLDASAMMRVPVGAVSPLWGLFMSAAATGAAFWWMSQWTKPQNLEAMFGKVAFAPGQPSVDQADITETVVKPALIAAEAAETMVEAVMDSAVEVVETLLEPMLEAAPALAKAVVEDLTQAEAEAAATPLAVVEGMAEAVEDFSDLTLEATTVAAEALTEAPPAQPGEIAAVTSAAVEETPSISDLAPPLADAAEAAESKGGASLNPADALEAPAEMEMPETPVGGESAPISVLAEADKPLKARTRKTPAPPQIP